MAGAFILLVFVIVVLPVAPSFAARPRWQAQRAARQARGAARAADRRRPAPGARIGRRRPIRSRRSRPPRRRRNRRRPRRPPRRPRSGSSSTASSRRKRRGSETLGGLFERLVAGRLLIWLGGIALVLAAVFLIRYSIEIGLMTPAARMIGAAVFGLVLLGAGEYARAGRCSPTIRASPRRWSAPASRCSTRPPMAATSSTA